MKASLKRHAPLFAAMFAGAVIGQLIFWLFGTIGAVGMAAGGMGWLAYEMHKDAARWKRDQELFEQAMAGLERVGVHLRQSDKAETN